MTQTTTTKAERHDPANPPVIKTVDLEPGAALKDAAPDVKSFPLIESTLVGNGDGLPAGARKDAAPLRLTGAVSPPKPATEDPKESGEPGAHDHSAMVASTVPPVQPKTTAAQTADAAPSPAPSPSPSHDAKVIERTVIQRRGGFVPMALGGVVAAALGAGAMWFAMPHLRAPQTAIADLSGLQSELTRQGDEIETRAVVAAQEAARQAADAAIKAAPAPEATDLTSALAPLSERLDTVEAGLRDLATRPAADPALASEITTLAARLASTEEQLTAIKSSAAQADERARAAATLASALDLGAPDESRKAAAATLEKTGVTDAAKLAQVPPLSDLRARWDDAARAALRAANDAAPEQGGGLAGFLRAQTGARSVVPRDGTDADAVLSRAGDAVQRGAIDEAIKTLEALPEPARKPMEPWMTDARAWVAAQATVGALTAADAVTVTPETQASEPQAPSHAAPTDAAPAAETPAAQTPAAQ